MIGQPYREYSVWERMGTVAHNDLYFYLDDARRRRQQPAMGHAVGVQPQDPGAAMARVLAVDAVPCEAMKGDYPMVLNDLAVWRAARDQLRDLVPAAAQAAQAFYSETPVCTDHRIVYEYGRMLGALSGIAHTLEALLGDDDP